MKRGCALLLMLAIWGGLPLRAESSLAHAREAREALGPAVWSRVVAIENTAARSRYPRTLMALVFEFGGILWFYTDTDGTQSLSLHRGRLAAEKADLGPLLAAIDPGFTKFTIVSDAEDGAGTADPGRDADGLPNGCFIASIAALRERVARGDLVLEARLLSFYADTATGRRGHTVLVYRTPRGAYVLDPTETLPRRLRGGMPEQPLNVARTLRPDLAVAAARWVPTSRPADPRLADRGGRGPAGAFLR